MKSVPLNDLGQQIEQLETQLKSLRGNYQSRQGSLDTLQRRKKELQTKLRQVEGQISAVVRGQAGNQTASATKKKSPAKNSQLKKAKPKPSPATGKAKQPSAQPPLRVVVTDILKQARKPLRTKELAERALASGYQTKSGNFSNAVQDLLKNMDNVQRVPNEGYRLKR